MAFSLQGFGAGFASKLTDRLDEERQRQEKLQDEATSIATRQRLAKQAKRDEEKRIAEELAGSLSVYFDDKQVAAIMGKGMGAGKEILSQAQVAASNGYAVAPLLNMSSAADLTDQETTDFTDEVISKTKDVPEIKTSVMDLEQTAKPSSGLLNLDYVGKINAPADKEQATLDAAYNIAIQKSLFGKTLDIRNKNKKLSEQLLAEIKKKDAALKTENTDSSPFSKSSIEAMQKTQMKIALEANDFAVDMEGRLTEKITNKVPQYNVAVIQANTRMRTLNTGEDGQYMSPQLHALTRDNVTQAIKKIQLDARQQHTSPPTTDIADRRLNPDAPLERYIAGEDGQQIDILQQNAQEGKYKIGDIIYVTEIENGIPVTRLQVYTGIALSSTHNNFINAGKI
jgi:hypothetical protein